MTSETSSQLIFLNFIPYFSNKKVTNYKKSQDTQLKQNKKYFPVECTLCKYLIIFVLLNI